MEARDVLRRPVPHVLDRGELLRHRGGKEGPLVVLIPRVRARVVGENEPEEDEVGGRVVLLRAGHPVKGPRGDPGDGEEERRGEVLRRVGVDRRPERVGGGERVRFGGVELECVCVCVVWQGDRWQVWWMMSTGGA